MSLPFTSAIHQQLSKVMRICRAAQQVNIRELQMCNIDDGGVEMPKKA